MFCTQDVIYTTATGSMALPLCKASFIQNFKVEGEV